jgi:diguanylate cyclase (GGDEF)-like protein
MRIGRRVVGLFILSALVPLGLCATVLVHEFTAQLNRRQQQSLDGVVRSFGETLLARLGSADDALKVSVTDSAATDESIHLAISKLPWVRSQSRVTPADLRRFNGLPPPDARQQRALSSGDPILLWHPGADMRTQVFLVRSLPDQAWLYVELDPAWLWSDAYEFAQDAGLLLLDEQGHTIAVAGTLPVEPSHSHRSIPADWMSRSWDVFLAGRFASPSWRLVAMRPRPTLLTYSSESYLFLFGFILATILLIACLSIMSIRRQLHPLELLTQAARRVAQRDFEAFRGMAWKDEFGDLARSFDAMSARLKTQFAALETLSEVDRMLLGTPELELILDTLLPRIATLLGCEGVSVLLFDPDSNEHVRAYDYCVSRPTHMPVRRIAADTSALRAICDCNALPVVDAARARELCCFPQVTLERISDVRLQPLKHAGECAGALCLGYASDAVSLRDPAVHAADLADRVSLILNNLSQSERLRRQANLDSLTGLQNRYLFSERVRSAIGSAAASQSMGSLLYVDLDQFKRVNDTAGHAAGDRLLRVVAERLTASVGEGLSIARLGGDEFAVLLPSIQGPGEAWQIAERVIARLQPPIVIDGREHRVSASIGIAMFPADGSTLEELLKAADIAMYHAKDAGRGRVVFFQAEMQQTLLRRFQLESDMHRAFQRSAFSLHYQPIVSEARGTSVGVEALVRWPNEAQLPWIAPAAFIPLAEDNGLIVHLGEWVLRSACQQFASWRSAGLGLEYVSVNVSVRQLREPGYLNRVLAALRDNGMQGHELQVEITESVFAHGPELERTLAEVAATGVRVALDDFGTGYSSLGYLRSYPISTVKVDRSFIAGLPGDAVAGRLAQSIISMCAALGKEVVAEGVETEAQRQFLRRAGCTAIQGHLVGRPMEAADIPGFTRRLRAALPSSGDTTIRSRQLLLKTL